MINAVFESIFQGSMFTLGLISILGCLHVPLVGPFAVGLLLDHYDMFIFTGEAFWGFCIVVWVYQAYFWYKMYKMEEE